MLEFALIGARERDRRMPEEKEIAEMMDDKDRIKELERQLEEATHAFVGLELMEQLAESLGVEYKRLRRIVLDVRYDDVAVAYIEMLGSRRVFKLDLRMNAIEVVTLSEEKHEEQLKYDKRIEDDQEWRAGREQDA